MSGIAVIDIAHEHGTEDDQRAAQHARGEDGQDGAAQRRRAQDDSNAVEQALARRLRHACSFVNRARQDPQRDGDGQRQVRRRVDGEAADLAPTLTSSMLANPGPRMREKVNCVALSASPAAILSCWNDRRHDRLERQHRQGIGDADDERNGHHHPRLDRAGKQQSDQQRRAEHLYRLKQRDHHAPVGAVGENAAGERQQPDRRPEREGVETDDEEGRRAQAQQQPGLRHLLRAGANVR